MLNEPVRLSIKERVDIERISLYRCRTFLRVLEISPCWNMWSLLQLMEGHWCNNSEALNAVLGFKYF